MKEYGLPESVFLETRPNKKPNKSTPIKWDTSKFKDYNFRILVKLTERKNVLVLYFLDEEEAKNTYNYLLFKKIINSSANLLRVFKRLSVYYVYLQAQGIHKLIQIFLEKKEEFFSSSLDSSDSGNFLVNHKNQLKSNPNP